MVATRHCQDDEPASDIDRGAVVQFLSQPAAYHEPTSAVECIETHISWVFLTDRHAYKLKKPVRFEFLDFSTVDKRRRACEQELSINRRLAPDIYLEVVPVNLDRRGQLHLGNSGTLVDWVVKMRRLPADKALDRRIASGTITTAEIAELSRRLIAFYQHLPPLSTRADLYVRGIEHHLLANRAELLRPEHGLPEALVKRVHAAQLRLLRLAPEMLSSRVCDGRIVEGHGDLRPEHVYFRPAPVVIDAIEFNDEFRKLDVLDELSFLAMECIKLGADWVGETIVHDYCQSAGDHPPSILLRFYESYRATVRAKVSALRGQQVPEKERSEYQQSAERYLRIADRSVADFGAPLLLIVRGQSGTGKSVLARELAEKLGCDILSSDTIRREVAGTLPEGGYNQGIYDVEGRARVYEELFRRAAQRLSTGVSVILDATFLAAAQRRQAFETGSVLGAEILFIRCHCPREVARQRVAERLANGGSASEISPAWLDRQAREEEPDVTPLPSCDVETLQSLPEMTQVVYARLRPLR